MGRHPRVDTVSHCMHCIHNRILYHLHVMRNFHILYRSIRFKEALLPQIQGRPAASGTDGLNRSITVQYLTSRQYLRS